MKKSNVIITVVLAAVSIFLLALWYMLGFNEIDSPLDLVISVLFPGSYLMNDLVFLPSVGFCSVVLVIREHDLLDRCLTAFLYGLLVDLFIVNTFLLHAVVYLIIALLLQLWSRHMGDSMIESVILCIATIFVKDLLIFLYMRISGVSELSFVGWIVSYEFLSIVCNGVLVFLVVLLQRVKNDYQHMKALKIRQEEKIRWYTLKSKK